MALNNLAIGLAEAGRREEALAPATEAVELYREQARANPATFAPELAMALNTLAIRLAEAGRRDEALGPATEAVELYREQARVNPAAYAPNLAAALNNLAIRLAEAGRDEALGAATEAVELYREQARANPAAYGPQLASALNNLAISLAEAGRRDEALGPATEAVELYRDQARANPAAYAPDLASALNNLAIRLAEAGRRDEAEDSFDAALADLDGDPVGLAFVVLARGQWRAADGVSAEVLADVLLAVVAFEEAGDLGNRGDARSTLRQFRSSDPSVFDAVWLSEQGELPVWLRHPDSDDSVVELVLGWVRTPNWAESRAYLDANAARC